MSYPQKKERNKDLVKKRKKDPKKWSWRELGSHFGISRPMALKIFKKYQNDY